MKKVERFRPQWEGGEGQHIGLDLRQEQALTVGVGPG